MPAKRKHGPGLWLCWPCADIVTNGADWQNRMWIPLPAGYRSKGGKCARCQRVVLPGQKAAKVAQDTPLG